MDNMNSSKTYLVTTVTEQLIIFANKTFLRLGSQGSNLGLKRDMAAKSVCIGYGSCASRAHLNLTDCFFMCRRTLPL